MFTVTWNGFTGVLRRFLGFFKSSSGVVEVVQTWEGPEVRSEACLCSLELAVIDWDPECVPLAFKEVLVLVEFLAETVELLQASRNMLRGFLGFLFLRGWAPWEVQGIHDTVHRPDQKELCVFKDLLCVFWVPWWNMKVLDGQERWSVGSWEHQGTSGCSEVWEPLLRSQRSSFKKSVRGTRVSESL